MKRTVRLKLDERLLFVVTLMAESMGQSVDEVVERILNMGMRTREVKKDFAFAALLKGMTRDEVKRAICAYFPGNPSISLQAVADAVVLYKNREEE